MAKVKISEFSANPANNTDIDGINIAENCPPSGINDAIRELMAQLKDFQQGTAGDSFNGPVGTTTAAAGAFTTLTASSTATLNTLASSGATLTGGTINGMAIGGTTAAAVSATTLTTSSTVTHNGGTANGVAYLNGSKVLTTGSALTFDGTNLGLATSSVASLGSSIPTFELKGAITSRTGGVRLRSSDNSMDGSFYGAAGLFYFGTATNTDLAFTYGGSEQMRLTSTGLGIGTSSPQGQLSLGSAASGQRGLTLDWTGSGGPYSVASFTADRGTGEVRNFAFTNFFQTWYTNNTERMRIDSSGNLGLGVTPSAWNSVIRAVQIGAGAAIESRTNSGYAAISSNQFINASGNNIYIASEAAAKYDQSGGQHRWFIAPSGTAGAAISFTQAMTLDASGFLGVGETSPTSRIHANGTIQARTGATGVQIYGDGGSGYVNSVGANPLIFQVNSTERARIDSSGNLLVGTTSAANSCRYTFAWDGATQNGVTFNDAYTGGATATSVFFRRNGTNVGSITTTATTTAYNTSSDYRLKENIAPMTGALAKVAALKPVTYTWKADGSAGEGFIAHELAEVCPAAVTGEKDAVDADGKPQYQGIDVSFLVGTLTAAIQEQQAIIEDMKTRLAAAGI